MTATRWTWQRRRALELLAHRVCRYSNFTSHRTMLGGSLEPCVHWQAAEWLIEHNLAEFTPGSGRQFVRITVVGFEVADEMGLAE